MVTSWTLIPEFRRRRGRAEPGNLGAMDGLERTGSPEVDAWFLSRLLFVWPASLFRLAKRRALQAEDLWTLPPVGQAQAITGSGGHGSGGAKSDSV